MRWLYIALHILTLTACGVFKSHDETSGSLQTAQLLSKRDSVRSMILEQRDPVTGWPSKDDCDGLLWAGLLAASGIDVDLSLAEDLPGHWQRRPLPCWTPEAGDVGSKSTISSDMVTGLLWSAWRAKDLALLQRFAALGEAHEERVAGVRLGWIVGEPYPAEASRVVIRQNLYGLVGRMIYQLSEGKDDRSYRHESTIYFDVKEDYARHIQTLGILLQGEVRGDSHGFNVVSVYEDELERLHANKNTDPNDALFQTSVAIYGGDYSEAYRLLMDDAYVHPTYVRGAEIYKLVHWLFAAELVLKYNADKADSE